MSALDLADLLQEYDIARSYSLALVEGLDASQLTWRPDENASAISWHLGHQGAVNHYMVRNLTAAEVTFNADFDAVFDSATPEPARGDLPPLDEIVAYRTAIGSTTHRVVNMIQAGEVGAPAQLNLIGLAMMRGIINHEYQHAKWVGEVAETMIERETPTSSSNRVTVVDGYYFLA